MCGGTKDVSFCVWLVSLSTVSPRPARAAAGVRTPVLFRAEPRSAVWRDLTVSIACLGTLGSCPPSGHGTSCGCVQGGGRFRLRWALGAPGLPAVELLGQTVTLFTL